MLVTVAALPARRSVVGYNGIHYPDTDNFGFVIPVGTRLHPNSWVGTGGYTSYTAHIDGIPTIVWIMKKDVANFSQPV